MVTSPPVKVQVFAFALLATRMPPANVERAMVAVADERSRRPAKRVTLKRFKFIAVGIKEKEGGEPAKDKPKQLACL